jgi:hypothetical protein
MPDEPLAHVLRAALPWRNGPVLTECGKLPGGPAPVLTLHEFVAKVKRDGKQRTSLQTCMTCWSTAARYQAVSWEASPVDVIAREVNWSRASAWPIGTGGVSDKPTARLFRDELLALAELVSRHREEFDGLVQGIADTPSLADRRRQGKRRAS